MLRIAEVPRRDRSARGAVSILPMDRPTGDRMVTDDRFKLLSFTGSPSVGWKMKAEAGKKKVVLELGGNAGAIVDADADLDWAVERLVYGSFAYAGQVCISVQRIYVVQAIYDEFASRFVERVRRGEDGGSARPGDRARTDGRREGGAAHARLGDRCDPRRRPRAASPGSPTAGGTRRRCSSTCRGTR